jgi:hypothetical protein
MLDDFKIQFHLAEIQEVDNHEGLLQFIIPSRVQGQAARGTGRACDLYDACTTPIQIRNETGSQTPTV